MSVVKDVRKLFVPENMMNAETTLYSTDVPYSSVTVVTKCNDTQRFREGMDM